MAETKATVSRKAPPLLQRLPKIATFVALFFVILAGLLVRRDLGIEELRPEYATKPSQFVVIDGMEVHYRDEGPRGGTPLLLLHGTSSSLHTWEGWTVRMKDRRRIIRLDLPGFGLTGPRPDGDYRTATYVAFLSRFLDHVGAERVDVAGNSFGGRLAWALAAFHPERVRKLILVDASGLPGMPLPKVFAIARSPVSSLLRWCTPELLVRKNVEEVYYDDALVEDALVTRHARLLRREGNREAVIARINTADPPSLSTRLRDIRAETLIMWGKHDVWIPVEYAREFQHMIPKSRVLIYNDAGHVPMEERAEETERDATAFLESRPIPPAP